MSSSSTTEALQRTTLRIPSAVLDLLRQKATAENLALNQVMIHALSLHVGIADPTAQTIANTADGYIWVSPLGNYGFVDRTSWRRFVSGVGMSFVAGSRWDKDYDTMSAFLLDVSKQIIARWTAQGLIITDIKAFWELCDLYRITSQDVGGLPSANQ